LKEKKKSKYVPSLLKQAHDREKNENLIYQHKIQNELNAEKEIFGDNFKEYITPAYSKQIAENKKYSAKLQKKDEINEKNDVTKQKDLSNFYLNLEKNVAFGGKLSESSEEDNDEIDNTRRSPSPETKIERAKRKRERAEEEMIEANRLKKIREVEKAEKIKALQNEYSIHLTDNKQVDDAKARFLERKQKKEVELAKLREAEK